MKIQTFKNEIKKIIYKNVRGYVENNLVAIKKNETTMEVSCDNYTFTAEFKYKSS